MAQTYNQNEISEFVQAYSWKHYTKIECFCLARDGITIEDSQVVFRSQVIDYVINNPDAASAELLRDLFIFETTHSSHAWSAPNILANLATQLLEKGGETYVLDFLEGLTSTFDTEMAIGKVLLSPEKRASIRQRLLKMQSMSAQDNQTLIDYGLEYFAKE